jgi:dimethylaniline monooxygenase (N-oxide forming)
MKTYGTIGKTIHNYLNSFAKEHDLPRRMRLETSVTKVARSSSGGWTLEVDNGPSVTCDKLIWAVGGTSAPILPKWPQENFTSTVIHSAQSGEYQQKIAEIDRAIVVGAAKSAFDTVYMLLKAGKKVDWVCASYEPNLRSQREKTNILSRS